MLGRPKIHTKPFIPPQLHNRNADLSKYCYDRRKENPDFKTRIALGEEDLILYTKHIGKEWKMTDIHSFGPISPPEWHKMWPKQHIPQMYTPPKGRYPSNKRDRPSETSEPDSDDSSTNETTKRHKIGTPEHAQTPSEVPTAQETPLDNKTPQNEEHSQHETLEALPRATHTGTRYLAPGWEKFFNGHTPTDPKQAQKKNTKNGEKGKSSTKAPTSSKNGQQPDNKKTGK